MNKNKWFMQSLPATLHQLWSQSPTLSSGRPSPPPTCWQNNVGNFTNLLVFLCTSVHLSFVSISLPNKIVFPLPL